MPHNNLFEILTYDLPLFENEIKSDLEIWYDKGYEIVGMVATPAHDYSVPQIVIILHRSLLALDMSQFASTTVKAIVGEN